VSCWFSSYGEIVVCPRLGKATALLSDAGYDYVELMLPHKMRGHVTGAVAGAQTTPQAFINGKLVGGAEDLEAYLRTAA
jgi:peroxiredoxin